MPERAWVNRIAIYGSHVAGIFLPGNDVRNLDAYQNEVGDLTGWREADLNILMDNGQSQLQRQNTDLEAIRARAQFLLTVTLAFVGVAVASTELVGRSIFAIVIWVIGIAIVICSAFGAGGVVVAKKTLRIVDTRLLSQQHPPLLPVTAKAVATAVKDGENAVATGITVFRDAVALFLVGFVFVCVGWVIALAS
ncbi:hypothetical protein FHX49_001496 [Microbacterium endophyticum]|uniref:Uncharacterized protein n=1 Tax=Microbacterium endophyticum TaxID=1526412 RepID=A0A7W4V3A2_9MICO|nr:hypothetical protein [Microbacterium endophyticum]MBB2975929.1 hypothetical protein [Microbacterium endophyticum]NIK37702.1 hypothetical protein [Microbacterium endophyticum]